MYDRLEDLPTLPFSRDDDDELDDAPTIEEAEEPSTLPYRARLSSEVEEYPTENSTTTTLPIDAETAYHLFGDLEATSTWLSVIRSVRVLEWKGNRPRRAAFLAHLEGATIGYTLLYRYWDSRCMIAWTTPEEAATQVLGRARFSPLGPDACLFHYELAVKARSGSLPNWADPHFDGHPPSAVIADFREYVDRHRPRR